MYRSFTDRVFGGVCGGIAPGLRVSPWFLRAIFALFSVVSLGVGMALYVALWWLLPQESLIIPRRPGTLRALLFVLSVLIIIGVWIADVTGNLSAGSGQSLLWPVALLVLSAAFFLAQLRGA